MAKGEGGRVGSIIEHIDHPLAFAFALTLVIIPMMALMTVLFAKLNWPGPQALVQHP
jgi:hypothetical protein